MCCFFSCYCTGCRLTKQETEHAFHPGAHTCSQQHTNQTAEDVTDMPNDQHSFTSGFSKRSSLMRTIMPIAQSWNSAVSPDFFLTVVYIRQVCTCVQTVYMLITKRPSKETQPESTATPALQLLGSSPYLHYTSLAGPDLTHLPVPPTVLIRRDYELAHTHKDIQTVPPGSTQAGTSADNNAPPSSQTSSPAMI